MSVKEEKSRPPTMIPIPIAEFILGSRIPVDLYVKLSDEKYILIAKAGSNTPKSQLTSYNKKEVYYLWVKRDEYNKIAQHSVAIAGVVVNKNDIAIDQKGAVLSAACSNIFTQLDHMGLSLEMYGNARAITEATVALCDAHRDLHGLFASLSRVSNYLVAHSMAVSALSVLIGQAMGWEKKVTLEKLALGGLLHDLGKKTLPPELLKKPISEMLPEEISHYETHAFRGMQMVLALGIVPDDIVSIIYEHHENSIGQGYPQRIRDVKIHPLAKVVGLANQFVELTMANPNCPKPKGAREALMYIEHTMGQPFNKEVFKALKRVVEKENVEAA